MINHQVKFMESHHILHLKFFKEKKILKKQIFIVLECSCGKYSQVIHHLMIDRAHDGNLILNVVLNGMRPPLLSNIPEDCAQMMQKCWDVDPSKRPTIVELRAFASNKSEEIYKRENLKNDINKKKDTSLFKK